MSKRHEKGKKETGGVGIKPKKQQKGKKKRKNPPRENKYKTKIGEIKKKPKGSDMWEDIGSGKPPPISMHEIEPAPIGGRYVESDISENADEEKIERIKNKIWLEYGSQEEETWSGTELTNPDLRIWINKAENSANNKDEKLMADLFVMLLNESNYENMGLNNKTKILDYSIQFNNSLRYTDKQYELLVSLALSANKTIDKRMDLEDVKEFLITIGRLAQLSQITKTQKTIRGYTPDKIKSSKNRILAELKEHGKNFGKTFESDEYSHKMVKIIIDVMDELTKEPPKRSQNQVYTEAVRILSLLYNKCLPLQEAGKNLDSSLKSKTVEKA
ncbi:MAG: hypothetical protein ABIH83_00230, partial [Candidatus Micrarchaeota archaeon]